MFAPYGGRLEKEQVIVYDCMDELTSFAGAPAGLADAESRSWIGADVVFTGGRASTSRRRTATRTSTASVGRRARALRPRPSTRRCPADDIAGLPRPIFAITGAVDERLDYGLIEALADAPGVGSVGRRAMIKVDPAALPRRPNLHYLGQKVLRRAAGYLKAFDVCLMPWALNGGDPDDQPDEDPGVHGPAASRSPRRPCATSCGPTATSSSCRGTSHFVELATTAIARFDPDREGRRSSPGRRARLGRHGRGDARADRGAARVAAASGRKARLTRVKADRREVPDRRRRPRRPERGPALEDTDFLLADKQDRPAASAARSSRTDSRSTTPDISSSPMISTSTDSSATSQGQLPRAAAPRAGSISTTPTQRYPFQGNLYGLPPEVIKEWPARRDRGVAARPGPPPTATRGQRPRRPAPNFLEWSRRTFGEGITRHFMQPYNSRSGGSTRRGMSSDWIAGRVLTPSLEEVIEGSLPSRPCRHGPQRAVRLPAEGGCEMFVSGLAKRVLARGGGLAQGRTLVRLDPKRRARDLPGRGPDLEEGCI